MVHICRSEERVSEVGSSKVMRFLFPESKGWGTAAFLALRVVVAAFWLPFNKTLTMGVSG